MPHQICTVSLDDLMMPCIQFVEQVVDARKEERD